jgi:C4-dicarboxylate-specific signal transduction histidine kinase
VRDDRGGIIELIGVAIDVTAQVKANLELRLQRVEMARMSRVSSMGELTASLAHELNQPLTAIASNAAAGRRMLAQGPPDATMFEELLADVSADARRAGDIIHGIHHFVRKSEGTRRPVSLNETVREVLRLLHSDLLGRGTTVETELEPTLPTVVADSVHLQQVLLNLLMNSLEAMQSTPAEKRRVIICTKRDADGFVSISVRDHGGGLPKDNLEKVFAHFYSTKPNGMGMGLTIVRSIVEAHGGKLSAENTAEGARFCFRLPAAPTSEVEEVA